MNKNRIIRFRSLTLTHIKNTEYGIVEMPKKKNNTAEIIGLYGQNGSGKTAVIDSLYFLQTILKGDPIPEEFIHYINANEKEASMQLEVDIEVENIKFEVGYYIIFSKTDGNKVQIKKETLLASKETAGRKTKKLPFMEYESDAEDKIFTPKRRFDEAIASNKKNRTNLMVAKRMAELNHYSYIFGETSCTIFCQDTSAAFADYAFIIQSLHHYACMDLFVIRNTHSGAISADLLLPMAFKIEDKHATTKGDFVVSLKEPTIIVEERFAILKQIIEEINLVLQTIIPGLTLGIYDYGNVLQANGTMGRKVDLVSKRDVIEIPIRYESEGIIKIISILNAFIRAYNNPSIFLAVDELDAGIYEYLLGELLDLFDKGGKGQLLFTSHNLRPLEMLQKDSILFSTSNKANRYIPMRSVGNTNNLRDVYLRSITLGGQKECIYKETDSLKIARALRKVGRELKDDR